MNAHRDVVLGTTEILEHILLQLDMRTLLLMQLVSRRWHELITTAPSLQQKLFFRPIAGLNPPVIKNPLLSELFPQWFGHGEWANKKFVKVQRLKTLTLARKDRNAAFIYKHASWRRMLVTQPPIQLYTRCLITITVRGRHTMYGYSTISQRRWKDPKPSSPEPLKMDTFYNEGAFQCGHIWNAVWWDSRTGNLIPSEFNGRIINPQAKERLEQDLKRDGMVILGTPDDTCTGRYGPTLGKRYDLEWDWGDEEDLFPTEESDLDDWEGMGPDSDKE